MQQKVVRHRFTVWVGAPATSGDGWSPYPDYSADDVTRMLRRVLFDRMALDTRVEYVSTEAVPE